MPEATSSSEPYDDTQPWSAPKEDELTPDEGPLQTVAEEPRAEEAAVEATQPHQTQPYESQSQQPQQTQTQALDREGGHTSSGQQDSAHQGPEQPHQSLAGDAWAVLRLPPTGTHLGGCRTNSLLVLTQAEPAANSK